MAGVIILTVHGCGALTREEVANSMFPCVPGSYWVTQDTFYTGEAELIAIEDLGLDIKETITDSVKKWSKWQGGTRVLMYQRIGKRMSTAVDYELFFDTAGVVFEINVSAGARKISNLPLWRMFPVRGDTIYEAGSRRHIYVYDTITIDGTVDILPKWESTVDLPIYRIKRGVGQIGKVLPSMASRLIEYRIGNGPIVKTRWAVQAPTGEVQD